jgi:hypothetical protein
MHVIDLKKYGKQYLYQDIKTYAPSGTAVEVCYKFFSGKS